MEKPVREYPRFELVWYDLSPADEPQRRLGELIGSAHMLAFIRESLRSLVELDDLDAALRQAELLVESYYQRLYFLRERAQLVVESLTGVTGLVQRDPTKREQSFLEIARKAPAVEPRIRTLLGLVHPDVEARNHHTHRSYLHLEFHTGPGLGRDGYDALDLLDDVEGTNHADEVRSRIWDALQRLGEEYEKKIRAVVAATLDLAEAAQTDTNRES